MIPNNIYKVFSIVAALLICVLLYDKCNTNNNVKYETKDSIVVITVDSIVNNFDTIYKPKYVSKTVDRFIHDTIIANVDTASILRDYFAKYYYSDTINDSLYKIVINDTLSQNKISFRNVNIEFIERSFKEKTIIRTTPIKNKLYVYGGVFINTNFNIDSHITFNFKRHSFSPGYDISNKKFKFGYSYLIAQF